MPDFSAYVEWLAAQPTRPGLQCDFLMDADGRPLVDFIGRYENLATDFATVAARFGWSGQLPHLNGSGADPDYRRYYTARTRNLIAELYPGDIEAFGYKFE